MSVFQDGSRPIGPIDGTIDATTVSLTDIRITKPSNVVEDVDEDGEPAGGYVIPGNPTITAQFQISASADTEIDNGDELVIAATSKYDGTWMVTNVDYGQGTSAYQTGNLSARKKINVS